MMFIGTEGIVYEGDAYCKSPRIFPDEKFTEARIAMGNGTHKKTEARSPTPDNPQLEWAHLHRQRRHSSSNFDYSAALTEFVLLGNLAVRSQQAVAVGQGAPMKVSNVEVRQEPVRRSALRYREGWGV